MAAPTGVLLMAHGTPGGPDEVEAFYTHIRRGKPPTADELAELQRRYAAIGGVSPLARRSAAQAKGLQGVLNARSPRGQSPPGEFLVSLGNKHASPMIENGVEDLIASGVGSIVGLVLAPHFARRSVGEYHERAIAAVRGRVPCRTIASWHDEPALVDLLAERFGRVASPDDLLIVTAHSLPLAALAADDPYVTQVTDTAARLAKAVGGRRHRVAWQSGGRGGVEWLGPDVRDVITEEAAAGSTGVVICAAGFTAEHLEVAYDLDIEAAAVAERAGVAFARTESLDDDPAFCALLADLVTRAVSGDRSPPFVEQA